MGRIDRGRRISAIYKNICKSCDSMLTCNMDKKLCNKIQSEIASGMKKARNKALKTWISRYGKVHKNAKD